MDKYAIYLRKSRADLEAEKLGEGETLTRTAWFEALDNQYGLFIGVYQDAYTRALAGA